MNKDAYYFSHDANARNDIKIAALIQRYGMAGYGQYWIIIEMLREQAEFKLPLKEYTYICLERTFNICLNDVKQFINDCINVFELFKQDENFFWSESLLRRMKIKEKIRLQNIEAGKKSAQKRKLSTCSTLVEQGKERKGKEKKVNKRKEREKNSSFSHKILFEKITKNFDSDKKIEIESWIKKNIDEDYKACILENALNIALKKGKNFEYCIATFRNMLSENEEMYREIFEKKQFEIEEKNNKISEEIEKLENEIEKCEVCAGTGKIEATETTIKKIIQFKEELQKNNKNLLAKRVKIPEIGEMIDCELCSSKKKKIEQLKKNKEKI